MSANEMEVDEEKEPTPESGTSERESKEIYLPGKPLAEGEELVCDESAYVMLHQAQTGAPCLSFDIVKDGLGNNRDAFPHTAYLVAGTQAARAHVNSLVVMKLTNLHKTYKENNDEDEDDDEEESDEEEQESNKNPKMAGALIKHPGCVNRLRCTTLNDKVVAASWSELGKVHIWDLSRQLGVIENDLALLNYNKTNVGNSVTPLFTFSGHQQEGFAIDWSPTIPGVLATGDCKRDIHVWQPSEDGTWKVDQRPLSGHTQSVEDIQWSPNERSVLASCSVDRSIRIWDTRAAPNKACMITAENAHERDINVINWNRNEPFIVSGGDDGFLYVWDLRRFKSKTPVAIFKHHTEPVTTVEWHPTDSAVFASGGADNQVALWDLSVEKDVDVDNEDVEGLPPQLLFIHQGQTDIKEVHWHPQIPGVIISTALSGFNIFKTISV